MCHLNLHINISLVSKIFFPIKITLSHMLSRLNKVVRFKKHKLKVKLIFKIQFFASHTSYAYI